jgi:GT2 family glycosyltransferase/glycosyltransferase involved in cell wall biosynthesis
MDSRTPPLAIPEHEQFYTGPAQQADFLEIEILRSFSHQVSALPKFSANNSKVKKGNVLNVTLRKLVRKQSAWLKHSTRRRRQLGVFVQKLPTGIRNYIFSAVASSTSNVNSLSDFVAHSADLGFGLNTSRSPRVSIIIPAHNAWFTTLKCLRALQRNFDSTPYEVILVDDASTDQTAEQSRFIRGLQIVKIKSNVGYLRATNLGATYAKSEFLVLLNNDTEPVSGWLDALVFEMDRDQEVAICGSTLLYPTGALQEAGGQIFSSGNAWNLGRGKDPLNAMYRFRREVDYASAASIIVRNSFWHEVGGFDERFVPAYCEDSDLCLAAWNFGYKVIFTPKSWVIHHEGVSHGTSTSSGLKAYQVKNLKKLQSKWIKTLPNHWRDLGTPRFEHLKDSKGIVFVADHQLPAASRDAGSIRTIQIIKHLLALRFHVVLTALDPSTTEFDLESLRDLGVEVHTSWSDALETLRLRRNRLTHSWLIRSEVFDFFADRLTQLNPKTWHVADLIDLKYEESSQGIVIDPKQKKIANSADSTILVSDIEAFYLNSFLHSKAVEVVWAEYEPRNIGCNYEESNGLVFVGGFRHTPNVEGIIWFAKEVVPHLRDLGFDSPIRVVGTGLIESDSLLLAEAGLQFLGRQDDLDEIYRQSRIAISPLLTGRGRKGKIGEALSVGMPMVITNVGAEGFGFHDDDEIAITDDALEFAKNIVRIHQDPEIWLKMSKFGQQYCRQNLGSAAMLNSIKSILELIDDR